MSTVRVAYRPTLVLGSDAARAIGRFRPEGTLGYRAKSGGPLRATRAEAEADERRTREIKRVWDVPDQRAPSINIHLSTRGAR